MNTKDKIVLITGASGGLGRSLVHQALLSGARKVYAANRIGEPVGSWDGSRVVPIKIDLDQPESIKTAARVAGDIDLLINNAGIYVTGGLIESDEADIRKTMDTNFFGTLRLIREFSSTLAKRSESAIVNILSIAAVAGIGGLGAYCASKAALHSASQTLRVELKRLGISVHVVFPGPIDTPMAKDVGAAKAKPELVAQNIFEGINAGVNDIYPDDVAKAIESWWLKDPRSVERELGNAPL